MKKPQQLSHQNKENEETNGTMNILSNILMRLIPCLTAIRS